jgi:uncharacterized protein with ParB-like and HNH nuclease domain
MVVPPAAEKIDAYPRTIRQLLSGRKYTLDYYQRDYQWRERDIEDLINDLTARFSDEYQDGHERTEVALYKPYFLGSIVISSRGGVDFLIDGQQRLTSLTLLVIHLAHLQRGAANAMPLDDLIYSQKYGKQSFNIDVEERATCMRALLETGDYAPTPRDPEAIQTIWARYEDIERLFPAELKGEGLPYFIDWLLDRVTLVEITTNDNDMAYEIFESMNDRGLSLGPTDMLKGYLLSQIRDAEQLENAHRLWKARLQELSDEGKDAASEFFKAWFRAKFAGSIRERKKSASPQDFELIGTQFNRWIRDHAREIGLHRSEDYMRFITDDFDRAARRYIDILMATRSMVPGLEPIFYNADNGFTIQTMVLLAPLRTSDSQDVVRTKLALVASYLDIFIARRIVNFRNFGYSTVQYTMFNLSKAIRDLDIPALSARLLVEVAALDDGFEGVDGLALNQRNRGQIRHLLARMTDYMELGCGYAGPGFSGYVDRTAPKPFEVEHIWADKYDRHQDEFTNQYDFAETRNRFGDLLLLPKDFNASYGALSYAEKLPHYDAQNVLARSLGPNCYQHNPSFLRLVQEMQLPFKAYPDAFGRAQMAERQSLYRRLCELIWTPDRLAVG